MNFQTRIPVSRQEPAITYDSKTVLLGSCFAAHMGEKLKYYQFDHLLNPFGVIFNPCSIGALIERAVNDRLFTVNDFFLSNGRWHCYELHSDCSHPDRELAVAEANAGVKALQKGLSAASHVLLTLGTAWVYTLKETGAVVANCHKQPQAVFEKVLLDTEAIRLELEKIDHLIKGVNPACTVVVTVSPVRHLRDGLVENQRSKAHLLAALHDFLDMASGWHYFPSYEILMDELRDYRFYADDMLHPSSLAVQVVWERFVQAWLAENTSGVMKQVDKVRRAQQHKPFDPAGEGHRKFLEKLEADIAVLTSAYPHMRFDR